MKAKTRLTVTNDIEEVLNVSYDLDLSNGESVHLNFHLPKAPGNASHTLHEMERAMIRRMVELGTKMLEKSHQQGIDQSRPPRIET